MRQFEDEPEESRREEAIIFAPRGGYHFLQEMLFHLCKKDFCSSIFHYREKVRECEARLSQSMEVYRQRCDNLGVSRASIRGKIEFRHVIMMRRMNTMVMDSVKEEILNKLKYGTLTF